MNRPSDPGRRRIVALTDGYNDSHTAKTAICVIRYKPEDVVAVLDRQAAGRTSGELLGVGGEIPVIAGLDEAPRADTLLIGIAPPGGKLPASWRPIVHEAIRRGMTVLSGLHDFLVDDREFVTAAAEHGAKLVDLRNNQERDVATGGEGFRPECLRLHTVAGDCSCGKMVAAMELARGLEADGVDAAFVATGQTGMVVADAGIAIDRVIADFVAGAAEKLVLADQHHDVIVVEGQGSLFHPRYSGVTLSLLHGVRPDGMVVIHPMGRTDVQGMPGVKVPPLSRVVEIYETMAALVHPARVIGVAVNGFGFTDQQVRDECRRLEDELGLPARDMIRHGAGPLVEAVRQLQSQRVAAY